MKVLRIVNLVLLVLLSVTSGITKVIQMPEELKFFRDVGFSSTILVMFGVAQLVGGVLLISPKMRKLGAIIVGVTFGISTILIFKSGNAAFGLFSILPILMCAFAFMSNEALSKDA